MYILPAFAENDPTKLHDFIAQHSFGLLISQVDDAPFATHLPFLLERESGAHGTLVGHMARANPHWRTLADQKVLAVFSGPHAYISPTWYEDENVVPTWNYTAIHASGRVRLVEDRDALLQILKQSVAIYERSMPQPWSFDGADRYIDRMLLQIIGFRIEIESLEGKWKLNQNHSRERRERVIKALLEQGGENAEAVAEMMRAGLVE